MLKPRLIFAGVALTIGLSMPAFAAGIAAEHLNSGENYAKQGDWAAALDEFLAATANDQSNLVAQYDLGVAYAHLENWKNAAEAERKAIALNSQYVPAYVELAWIQMQTDDLQG